jgi:uncharacterized repeat protein (TIGR01451 family)
MNGMMLAFTSRAAMLLLTGIGCALLPAFADDVNPQEQLLIYELNRARNDPIRFQTEHSNIVTVDLSGVAAQMPLALNAALNESARFRADEMVTNNYCMHQSAVTGRWPNYIARSFGYPLPAFYPDDNNYIESIFCEYGPISVTNTVAEDGLAALIEDDGIDPPGHRIQLLATDPFFQDNREIGCGISSMAVVISGQNAGRSRISVQTAQASSTNLFLTGVVYNDVNGNFRYDLGEGLGDVTVDNGVTSVLTRKTGGWAIQVSPGTYQLLASGGAFSGVASAQVTVVDKNIEIDFQSGNDQGEVDFANQSSNADLSLTQTDAPDPARVDDNLTYVLTIRNNGPSMATGVILTDNLPAGVVFTSATSDRGPCVQSNGVVTCDLGSLTSKATAKTLIVVVPGIATQICNTASVTGNEADPVPTNNTATTCSVVIPPVHDLAVTKIRAPKKLVFATTNSSVAATIAVSIQNLSPHSETITDLGMLSNLVTVAVQSLGGCPDIVPVVQAPKPAFPVILKPKKKLTVVFRATYNCINDSLPTDKTTAHNDYRTIATVHHAALNGKPDSNPVNDVCPRGPNGADKGCGNKDPVTKLLGGDVFTDIIGP